MIEWTLSRLCTESKNRSSPEQGDTFRQIASKLVAMGIILDDVAVDHKVAQRRQLNVPVGRSLKTIVVASESDARSVRRWRDWLGEQIRCANVRYVDAYCPSDPDSAPAAGRDEGIQAEAAVPSVQDGAFW